MEALGRFANGGDERVAGCGSVPISSPTSLIIVRSCG
jgi:hypothetical protein